MTRARFSILVACFLSFLRGTAAFAQAVAPGDDSALPDVTTRSELGPVEVEPINATSIVASQDLTGFMWFGGQDGLRRFDGYDFKLFQHNPQDSTSISVNRIESLLVTRDGTVWVGTFGGGLNRYNEDTESFTHFVQDPNDPSSLSQDTVAALIEDRNGIIWVGTHGGLNRFDPETGRFTRFTHSEDDPTSLSNDQVRVIYEDSRGTIWVGTGSPEPGETRAGEGGLNKYDPATGTFTRYMHRPGDPTSLFSNEVMSLFEDSRGTFWVGTAGDGLHTMDRDTGTFTRYLRDPSDPSKLSRPFNPDDGPVAEGCNGWECGGVSFIHEDSEGLLWIGGLGVGIRRYDPISGASDLVEDIHPNVWNITESHDGSLYVSTWGGGYRVVSSVNSFPLISPPTPDGDSPFVTGLLIDREERLWVATFEGIHRYDLDSGTLAPESSGSEVLRHLAEVGAITVTEDWQGEFWFGLGDGAARWDPVSGDYTRLRFDADDPASISNNAIVKVLEDSRRRIWLGTFGSGVDIFDPSTLAVTNRVRYRSRDPKSLTDDFAIDILEDADKTIWIGTRNGLNKLIGEDEHGDPMFDVYLIGKTISYLYVDRQGRFWVGTWGDGLYLLDPQTGMTIRYGREQGLAAENVAAMIEDDDGYLWISTSEGGALASPHGGRISRFDLETGTFTNFDQQSGLPDIGFFLRSVAKDRDGVLYFGGGGGLTAFHPSSIQTPDRSPPKMALTHLRIYNRDVEPGPESILKRPIHLTHELVLAHDQNDLTIDYTALSFRDPTGLRYHYRLDPQDQNWVSARSQRSARYSGLNPGAYTFRVKAIDSRGIQSVQEATIAIRILPPWWKTTWAYLFYALLFAGALYGVDRFQRGRVIRKERERAQARELEQAREIEKAYNELRETKDRLVHQEKLASLGQLTAGIAHEIKNPLNFVTNFSKINEELADELRDGLVEHPDALANVEELLSDLKRNAAVIAQHGQRADGIVRSMMDHASGGAGTREATDINKMVKEYVALAYHAARARDHDFNCEIEQDLDQSVGEIEVVSQDVGRVLLNLLGNSFDAVIEKSLSSDHAYKPSVRVQTKAIDGPNGVGIEIRVADNGNGVPRDIKEKIFDPFFTTKPTGSGTGLGLSLSYDIVTNGHSGSMRLEDTPGGGATFVISLPR